jgi:hypothetical protein
LFAGRLSPAYPPQSQLLHRQGASTQASLIQVPLAFDDMAYRSRALLTGSPYHDPNDMITLAALVVRGGSCEIGLHELESARKAYRFSVDACGRHAADRADRS